MNTSNPTPSPARRVVLGCLGIPVTLILLTLLGGWLWYQGEMSKARRDLAAEVKFVRERGLPLTTVELDAAYRPDPEREDITAELLKALAVADDRVMKQFGHPLPIVGTGSEPPTAEWAQLTEAERFLGLAHFEPLFRLLASLPGRRVTVRFPGDYTQPFYMPASHLTQIRYAGRVLYLRWHVEMHRGRPKAAIDRIVELLALNETLRNEPSTTAQLSRAALNGVAVHMLQEMLQRTSLADADLARLQLALRHFKPQQAWSQAVQGERASFYSLSSVPLSMFASNPPPPSSQATNANEKRPVLRPHDAALALQLFRRMELANDESIQRVVVTGIDIDQELKVLAGTSTQRLLLVQTMMIMPSLGAAANGIAQNAAALQAADAGLAAVRFRQVNQVWPQSLAQLVPEFLPQVPVDPFDGKPLRIVVTEREFKVYSVGKDQTDDGGDLAGAQPKDRGFTATWFQP